MHCTPCIEQRPTARNAKANDLCSGPLTTLKSNDKLLVCRKNKVGKRYLPILTDLGCDSSFVQVKNGIVGIQSKDRFSIVEASPVNFTTDTIVPFNTTQAIQQLNCKNRWSDTTNSYSVGENGIYQVQAVVVVSADVTITSMTLRIQSVLRGTCAESTLSIMGTVANTDRATLNVETLLDFAAGDVITIEISPVGSGTALLLGRTISIIQL